MKLLSLHDRLRWSPSGLPGGETTHAMAECLLLEQCVQRCEAFATVMHESGVQHPLFAQLSECIAACEAYLAARSRESAYATRFGLLCREVCAATAEGCRELDCEASLECRRACRAAVRLIGSPSGPDALWN